MAVRTADPQSDAAACAAIYAPHVRDGVASFEEVPPSADAMADRMRRTMATHPWVVDEREGTVAGYAYASAHRSRAGYRWAVDVAVYVHPARHRGGVGRALYGELLARLRAQGFRTACAGITLPNDASVGLHEALGFTPVGLYRDIGFKHGSWHDVGWWQRDLAPAGAGPPAEPGPRAP